MVSLKISLSIHQLTELRAKIKLESDSPENSLPFENLLIEALPSKTESADIHLRITNTNIVQNELIDPPSTPCPTKRTWWQKLITADKSQL
jgi:hypothetical protein